MRIALVALLLAGCSEDSSNLVAELSWSFNYRDWTKPNCTEGGAGCTADDVRGCDNERSGVSATGYDPIANVEVSLENADTPPYLEEIPCGRGLVGIKGLVRQTYHLRMSAKNAAGVTMYEYVERELDLSSFRAESYELRPYVGELRHFPHFPAPDDVTCPDGIESFHYTVTDDETSDLVSEGNAPACDGLRNVNSVYIRNLPVEPVQTETGGYTTSTFRVQLDARNAQGTVQYCGTLTRPVFPGNNNLGSELSQNLAAGACP
jgi:hypothetical protein